MKIQHIYIAGYKGDVRFTQCCVASIRQWYPEIRISLVKDESKGGYDTSDLQRYWDVDVFPTDNVLLGYGMGKLKPLLQPGHERLLVLDSDVVFIGRVLDRLEQLEEDFVVERSNYPRDDINAWYLNLHALSAFAPEFHFPGYVFNTGQIVATAGILTPQDFEPYIAFRRPAAVLRPDIFKAGDQGVLNYVLLNKMNKHEITLRREPMMRWPGSMRRRDVRISKLDHGSGYPLILHWSGPKHVLFMRMPMGYLLSYFEDAYYARIPGGRRKRRAQQLHNLSAVVRGQRPWYGYA
jgi:hypothetical protein